MGKGDDGRHRRRERGEVTVAAAAGRDRESGPTVEPSAASVAVPVEEATSMWRALSKLFAGEYPALVATSVSSFLGGMSEATLLVLIANLALSIGGESLEQQQSGIFDLASRDTGTLFWLALVLTALRLLFQFVASRMAARTVARLTQRTRFQTFDDYVHASWELQSAASEAAVQDLLIRHVAKSQSALIAASLLLSTGFMVLALIGSAFLVDPVSAGFIIVVGGLLFVGLRPLTVRAKRLSRKQVEEGLAYGVQSREAVDLSLEIRSFGVDDQVAARLDEATRREIDPLYRSQLMSRMLTAIYTSAAVMILLFALLGIDTFLERPLASIGAIVVVLIRALNQTSGLQSTYHNLGEYMPFLERLDSERERFRRSRPPSGEVRLDRIGSVRFEGVSYSYDDEVDALSDLSFEVRAGEAIGIIGPSGSGKSTLIQLLLRLRHPQRGRYLVDGVDVKEIDDRSWFDLTSFVPQDSRVYDASIADNIRFFRDDVTQAQIEAAARRAHLHDEIMRMPDGYETRLGSRGGALSGGQRQRVAIARALVRQPSMLVLDEPTSALDMRSESLVHETLSELKGTTTLFVIAHRLSTLNTCDRIMVMRQGRLQSFGLRSELEQGNEFYREALELSRIRS
jgi:ATP-binding cassette subfamily B protein